MSEAHTIEQLQSEMKSFNHLALPLEKSSLNFNQVQFSLLSLKFLYRACLQIEIRMTKQVRILQLGRVGCWERNSCGERDLNEMSISVSLFV